MTAIDITIEKRDILSSDAQVLIALESEARRLGLVRVVLETGVRQARALSLYERNGFARIAPFGEYVSC